MSSENGTRCSKKKKIPTFCSIHAVKSCSCRGRLSRMKFKMNMNIHLSPFPYKCVKDEAPCITAPKVSQHVPSKVSGSLYFTEEDKDTPRRQDG